MKIGKLTLGHGNVLRKVESDIKKVNTTIKKDVDKANSTRKKVNQKVLKKAKTINKKALANVKKVNAKIKSDLKKVASKLNPKDARYIPLLPFKNVMKGALDRAKVPYNNSLSGVSEAFLEQVVNKRPIDRVAAHANHLTGQIVSNVQNGMGMRNRINGSKVYSNVHDFNVDEDASSEQSYTEKGSTASQYEAGAKKSMGVIKKVLQWFKDRKAKKAAKKAAEQAAMETGNPMPENYGDLSQPPIDEEEEKIVDEADIAATVLNDAAKKDVAGFMGSGFSGMTIFFSVTALTVLLALAFKGKKKAA